MEERAKVACANGRAGITVAPEPPLRLLVLRKDLVNGHPPLLGLTFPGVSYHSVTMPNQNGRGIIVVGRDLPYRGLQVFEPWP